MSSRKNPDNYFIGKPCKKCGNTQRYISCKKCVECDIKRSTANYSLGKTRRKAKYQKIHYEGKACINCGNNKRTVVDDKCVYCNRQSYLRLQNERIIKYNSSCYYEGLPCLKCNSTLRYVRGTGECVMCKKERNSKR